nr:MAG TPA: hypothetical protein [Caudoviricetes sp.]
MKKKFFCGFVVKFHLAPLMKARILLISVAPLKEPPEVRVIYTAFALCLILTWELIFFLHYSLKSKISIYVVCG